jgi:hypothetical protein
MAYSEVPRPELKPADTGKFVYVPRIELNQDGTVTFFVNIGGFRVGMPVEISGYATQTNGATATFRSVQPMPPESASREGAIVVVKGVPVIGPGFMAQDPIMVVATQAADAWITKLDLETSGQVLSQAIMMAKQQYASISAMAAWNSDGTTNHSMLASTASSGSSAGEPSVVSAAGDQESPVPVLSDSVRRARGSKVPSWVAGLTQDISRNKASLISAETRSERDWAVREQIEHQLFLAEETLRLFVQRNWLVRLISAGAVYEEVLAMVQVTSEDLLLIEDDALVQARLPNLHAGIKAYLGASDPRFDNYTGLIDRLSRENGSSSGEGNIQGRAAESTAAES